MGVDDREKSKFDSQRSSGAAQHDCKALAVLPDKSSSLTSDVGPPQISAAAVSWYGFICFLCLLLLVFFVAVVAAIAGFKLPLGFSVACLVLSVHFANWLFVRKYRRAFLTNELRWFAIACGAAFCLLDEPLALIARIAREDQGPMERGVTIVVACVYDIAIAAAVVYATVPWISKFIGNKNAQ